MEAGKEVKPSASWWSRLLQSSAPRDEDDAADYGTAFGLDMAMPDEDLLDSHAPPAKPA